MEIAYTINWLWFYTGTVTHASFITETPKFRRENVREWTSKSNLIQFTVTKTIALISAL